MADTFTVTKAKVGAEDIQFGTGSFQRYSADGVTLLTIQKVNATDIPVVDETGVFEHKYLEDVLKELYDLFTDSHIQTWYYVDENGTVLHGMGDVINQPTDGVDSDKSWYMTDGFGQVIHGMGDVIDL